LIDDILGAIFRGDPESKTWINEEHENLLQNFEKKTQIDRK